MHGLDLVGDVGVPSGSQSIWRSYSTTSAWVLVVPCDVGIAECGEGARRDFFGLVAISRMQVAA